MRMFESLLFTKNRLEPLSYRDIDYWQIIMRKILKVGQEIEFALPRYIDAHDAVERVSSQLRPTNSVFMHGDCGVKELTGDGSVPHGLELITVGKRFHWKTFQEMNKRIIASLNEVGAMSTYHTGMHIHMLAGYVSNDISDLERPMPEIILANFYQLHRIFALELYWMASAGAKREAMTRYILFRRPPFDYSAARAPLRVIQDSMAEMYGKYQMVNMNPTVFGRDGIQRFHVEIRHPDTILSPTYITAIVALEVALLQKAIDMSRCGIISLKQDMFDEKRDMFNRFANLGIGYRESYTDDFSNEDIEKTQIHTSAFIQWLKPELMSISETAYEALKRIAVTPASMLLIEGREWSEIENEIYPREQQDEERIGQIFEIIALQKFTGYDEDSWKKAVAEDLGTTPEEVAELLRLLGKHRILSFDTEIGGYMLSSVV